MQGVVVPALLLGVAALEYRAAAEAASRAQHLPGLCSCPWGPTPEHPLLWRCDDALLQAYSKAGAEQLGKFSACS